MRRRQIYKTGRYNGRRQKKNTASIIFALVTGMLFIGVVTGSLWGNFIEGGDSVNSYIANLLEFDINSLNQKATFNSSLYKYSRLIVILWVSGFFTGGLVIVLCMLLVKAFAYGFTTAVIFKSYGYYGFVIAVSTYIPQNIFILSALFFVSVNALCNIYTSRLNKGGVNKISLIEYIFVFIIGLLCCVVAALIETFLTPILIDYMQ